ncbi:MAG: DNA polymerase/3'-5' exonuclease PolX [Candidatus Korarchaeota archaeon]|nr:DNA polymerase/3'-5' exonuclease PolX [Candidatus Korarchaeota archaeon]NIU84097.1 DNA polymerase/3'-5' exonuclease PolX [Candidatus Thorarchaeota archaeon]NIW14241.1 DNA polymerase/3'-5' exonuclease PolX [Candidatus Thorarchaeota archaeon]NIW52333.1 DNA polymerase/3'-5' exonuclease PolX [Candidatus Korarchaeota archaeon]
MLNKDIANIFNEIADLLELKGVEYKPRAYRRAARNIEAMKEETIKNYYETDRLTDIEGVGKSLAAKIHEIIETGSLGYLEQLRNDVPERLRDVMGVPGLGPKSAKKLYEELGISDLGALKAKAEAGDIRKVKGFGKKTEQQILKGIRMLKEVSGRRLISEMMPIAKDLKEYLSPHTGHIAIAGSLRRWKETIGDIDMVSTGVSSKIMDTFVRYADVDEVLVRGETKTSIRLENGVRIDLRVVDAESYGAAVVYFTGSKAHNIALRKIANERDYKLNEYGLFERDTKNKIAGKTEEDVYKALSLSWIPPELREDRGELKAAKKNALPDLITLEDIKGDLQTHSDWSDGHHSIEEMAREAKQKGYEYIALTDHSEGIAVVEGMSMDDLDQRLTEIENAQKAIGITILNGVEVDIRKDGSLEMDTEALESVDLVIGAIHSNFKLNGKEQTQRIKDAFSTGLIDIFAHPTGRKIGVREPYEVNFSELCTVAKTYNVALEINAFPRRFDLDSEYARNAMQSDVMLSLGTDAHGLTHLDYMKYGVGVARRAWLEPKHLLNTRSYKELVQFLKAR